MNFHSPLRLPELSLPSILEGAGQIHFVLQSPFDAPVTRIDEVSISQRRAAEILLLASGERVIVTEQAKCRCPDDAIGVIRKRSPTDSAWIKHRQLSVLKARIEQSEWPALRQETVDRWATGFPSSNRNHRIRKTAARVASAPDQRTARDRRPLVPAQTAGDGCHAHRYWKD